MQDNKSEVNQNSSNNQKKVTGYKPQPKSSAQKKREQQDYKRKYFDYYDDVKTNIKQDW